jgi:hypothetical protein
MAFGSSCSASGAQFGGQIAEVNTARILST